LKWLEYIRLAIYEIWHNKIRTFLTLIGIIIGIASVILIIYIIQGAEVFLLQELEKIAPTDVLIAYTRWDPDTRRSMAEISPSDIKQIKNVTGENISAISPRYSDSESVRKGVREEDATIIAGNENIDLLYDLDLARGRFLTNFDILENNKVAVLSQEIAGKLFPTEDPLGKNIRMFGTNFRIIGILLPKEESIIANNINENNIYMPVTTYQRLRGRGSNFSMIMIKVSDKKLTSGVIRQINNIFNSRYGLDKFGRSKFFVREWVSGLDQVQVVKTVLLILLSSVASVTLLVAGIGLMNIMLVIVTERTREIGLRKALGAKRRDILFQFMIEAIVLCISGGTAGVLLGIFSTEIAENIATQFIDFSYQVPEWAIITSLVFTTSIGLFFGIYPAVKAARLNPIEALRHE